MSTSADTSYISLHSSSIVVEIKAAEIISNSTSYASEYTLRFPRFLRIREDKNAESCMTLSEVHRMYRDYKGKLSTKSAEGFRHEYVICVEENYDSHTKELQDRF